MKSTIAYNRACEAGHLARVALAEGRLASAMRWQTIAEAWLFISKACE